MWPLAALPATLLHGEFYPSNIMVREAGGRSLICPLDWELAALGPGLVDLAALTAGAWTEAQREQLALCYHEALPRSQRPLPRELLVSLDYCRLHLAVQWLGWAVSWSPPREHRHDWGLEVAALTEKLFA